MNCPSCKHKLNRTTYAGANVRHCPHCSGLFLPKRRAESIQRRVDKDRASLESEIDDASHEDLATEIRCPECRNKMSRRLIRDLGFFVDECDNCDMAWFDAGELARMQLAYDAKTQTKELDAMRERLNNMTDQERCEYEQRIAELPDLGSPMQQALTAAFELSYRYYRHRR